MLRPNLLAIDGAARYTEMAAPSIANQKPNPSQDKPGQAKQDQSRPVQARPDQTRIDQTRPDLF